MYLDRIQLQLKALRKSYYCSLAENNDDVWQVIANSIKACNTGIRFLFSLSFLFWQQVVKIATAFKCKTHSLFLCLNGTHFLQNIKDTVRCVHLIICLKLYCLRPKNLYHFLLQSSYGLDQSKIFCFSSVINLFGI